MDESDFRTYWAIFLLGIGVFAITKKGRDMLIEFRDKGLMVAVLLTCIMVAGTAAYLVIRLAITLARSLFSNPN